MADDFKIELIESNISGLMRSSEMVSFLRDRAEEIRGRCSGTYETSEYIGENRANVSICTTDRKTYFKNLKDNELAKALRG